jgi:hypothetical protein
MSSYKVIQDIEAEDKLIGPLTLRQSIYGGITMVCMYICFLAYAKHAFFLIGMVLPVAAITGFFAFPWKGEQPTEIWALARLRFMIKPRVRVWDQSGVKDVVTVLAPKKLETIRPLTNNLSEYEVRSRLKALADTIDSRGWATRNASYALYSGQYQTRVVAPGQMAPAHVQVANDIFDDHSNVAQNFDAMLAKSSQDQRQRLMQRMAQAQQTPQQMPPQQQFNPNPPMNPQMNTQNAQRGMQMPTNFSQFPAGLQAAPARPVMPQVIQPNRAPQLPAPVMPAVNRAAQTGPAPTLISPTIANRAAPAQGTPPNNLWFAHGPAYPGSTTIPATPPAVTPPPALAPTLVAAPPAPALVPTQAPAAQQSPATATSAPVNAAIPDAYVEAISSGKISADVPIAGAATPNADEAAFAEIVKQHKQDEQKSYNHTRVLPTSVNVTPAAQTPSVPGMIDYGRPQPTEDQMQYDTSMPQSTLQTPVAPVTQPPHPAILELAKNDDLDVATIARQAHREIRKSPDEVEIRLH